MGIDDDRRKSPMNLSGRETRDALRLALQSAVAAAAMFSIMQALELPEKFVGVLSAVLVVQPSIGNTLAKAWDRFAATVIGCIIGAACLWLMPDGYGTAGALALSMLVMNAAAGFKPAWRYGVVAAVALALGSDAAVLSTALERSLAIGIGVVVGIVVSLVVWPDSARKRAERYLRSALRASTRSLETTLDAAARKEPGDSHPARSQYSDAISSARQAADNIRFADREAIIERISAIERFYHAILILERVTDESGDGTQREDAVVEPIETIRQCSCKIARGIADGNYAHDERLASMNDALKRLREHVVHADDEPVTHEYRNALLFGLDEIEDSIRELLRTLPENDGG